jgi:hypothetical protein
MTCQCTTTSTIPSPRSGCETSLLLGISPRAMSTNAASLRSSPPTSPAMPNATSSPASADGPPRSDWPIGTTLDLFGPARRLARGSALHRGAVGYIPTSGPSSGASWLQHALEYSLASKSRISIGGIELPLTWKREATPQGRPSFRLSWSVKTMRARGVSLLATPTAKANQACASMAKWPGCRDVAVSPQAWASRMGFPPEWLFCAPSEMPSSRNSPRRSSAQQGCEALP